MESKARYYYFILIEGIIIGLIVGFIMGSLGTYTYFKLTTDESAFGFLYGLGTLMLGAGIIGASIGGIISGFAFHRLAKSQLSHYAHYITAIILFVVFIVAIRIFSAGH